VINTFNIPALQERYEFLRQLGQIFLLTPEVLKSYITEDYLGRIDAALLKPYLAMRADWGQQSEKAFNDGAPGTVVGPPGSAGIGNRFARLSTMMRELDVNRLGEGMGLSHLPNMPSIPSGFSTAGFGQFNNRFSLAGARPM
jgi:exocyst complex component 5